MAFKRTIAFLLAAIMLSLAAVPANATTMEEEEPTSGAIFFDIILTRPLGIVATAVGAVVFVLGLPFTILSKSVGTSAGKLVKDPLKYTFTRPVGELDFYNDGYNAALEQPVKN